MAEFEEKLNSILGNEKAMGQIMALAQSLGKPAPGRYQGRTGPRGMGHRARKRSPPSLRNRAARPIDPGTCPRCWGR